MKYMNMRRKYMSNYPFTWCFDKYLGVWRFLGMR